MECPECHGEGRILLFTSSKECGSCKGTGAHQETPETAASARTTDPPVTLQNAYEGGGAITITTTGTGASPSGDITINSGNTVTSGLGGSVTLTAGDVTGNTNNWYTDIVDTSAPVFPLASGGGSSFDFLTGNERPTDVDAPLGSMYMCEDDGVGSIWVKTSEGPGGWAQLATHAGGSQVGTDEVTDAINSVVDSRVDKHALISLVAEEVNRQKDLRHRHSRRWINTEELNERLRTSQILGTIPVVAPVSTCIIADMMAMIEQRGHEVLAFVSSARDFADIRKFAEGPGVKWEGKQCSYFGVPFFSSAKIRSGNMAAVASDHRMVFCSITR